MWVILKQITFVTLSIAVPAAAMALFAGFNERVRGNAIAAVAFSPVFGLFLGTIRGIRELRGTLKQPTVEQQRRFEKTFSLIALPIILAIEAAGVWFIWLVAGPHIAIRFAITILTGMLAFAFISVAMDSNSGATGRARLTAVGIAAFIFFLIWVVF